MKKNRETCHRAEKGKKRQRRSENAQGTAINIRETGRWIRCPSAKVENRKSRERMEQKRKLTVQCNGGASWQTNVEKLSGKRNTSEDLRGLIGITETARLSRNATLHKHTASR
jgi:hypothetical protein